MTRAELERCLAEFAPIGLRWLRQRLRTPLTEGIDPEDVYQEACRIAWINHERLMPQAPGMFHCWMKNVLECCLTDCIRAARAKKRGGAMKRRPLPRSSRAPADFNIATPSGPARQQEQVALIEQALERLPEKMRLALTLNYLQSLSTKQVARKMGITESAAESLLNRARKAFRKVAPADLVNQG